MGQQHALRLARGARGVGLTGDVVVRSLDDSELVLGEKSLECGCAVRIAANAHHGLDSRLLTNRLDHRYEVSERDDQFGPTIGEEMADFAGFVLWIHRHDDRAGSERAVEGDDELREIREIDAHPVARLDARRVETGGEPPGSIPELLVAQLRSVVVNRRRLGMVLNRRGDVRHEIRHGFSCGDVRHRVKDCPSTNQSFEQGVFQLPAVTPPHLSRRGRRRGCTRRRGGSRERPRGRVRRFRAARCGRRGPSRR